MKIRKLATTILPLLVALPLAAGCDDGNPTAPDGTTDAPTDGTDADGGCTTTAPYCSADRTQVLSCNPLDGSTTIVDTCGVGEACIDGACTLVSCTPGESRCLDPDTEQICRADGSGWDDFPCPSGERCNAADGHCGPPCLLRIFIVLDQSGSMGGDTSPTKWDQAQDALHAVMTSEIAADVEFGFGVFPSDGDCETSGLVVYPVPEATDSNVQSYFADGPYGNTPLVDSIQFFIEDAADTANVKDPAYHNAILVVSDGSDTCYTDVSSCILGCGMNFACIIACEESAEELTVPRLSMTTAQLRDMEVRTFVIGFGSDVSDAELTAIAENGGTSLDHWIEAGSETELEAAFEAILDEMWECNPILI